MISKELTADRFDILLIEDNPADAELVEDLLAAGGRSHHEVVVATRMDEAIQKLRCRPYDLLLLDLRLPDASGLEAIRMVREVAPKAPLIVLTGIEDEFLALSCINSGAQDYLSKGEIKPLTLRRAIDHAVTRTREAELQAQLRAQLQQAQKMEALGTLAGGIAHDFNNSLAVILGNSEMLLEDLPEESDACVSAREIRKAALLAKELVGRILAFSRPHEPRAIATKVAAVVEEALQMIASTLPKNIVLSTDFPPDLPDVTADPAQIQQVVVNLCTNAAHAIAPNPGSIRIKAERVSFGRGEGIPGSDVQEGAYVCLRIRDDGAGMSEAVAARVFEPFFTTKAAGKGSGLGLSIVHSILKSHQGAVTVESDLGIGTEFRLYFPVFTLKTSPVAPQRLSKIDGAGRHILLVDDDEALAYLLPRRLRRMGFEVTAHTDPLIALQDFRARPNAFHAIVSDYNMPSMNGAHFAKQIQAIRPGVPTIVTSGFVRDEDAAAAKAAGAHALIGKPSSIEEMANLIDEVLRVEAP